MKYFLTFHGGPDNYYDQYGQFINFNDACHRLLIQAMNTGLFDQFIYANDHHLRMDPLFWPKHKHFIETHPKGYGYWLWKPYLIQQILSHLKDNDILLYCDAGCEIDIRDKEKIQSVFERVKTDLIIGSEVGPEWGCEQMWCKKIYTHYWTFKMTILS